MQLTDDAGFAMTGIYFGDGDEFVEKLQGRDTISVLYYPEIDEYQGRENLQVIVKSWC